MSELKYKRFYVEDLDVKASSVSLEGTELHHMKNVLRMKEGDSVSLFNGRGVELIGTLTKIERSKAEIVIVKSIEPKAESRVDITLIQGFVKSEKTEIIVQKATELGVKKIRFYTGAWTKVKVNAEDSLKKIEKLKKVAVDAAKQCDRSFVPEILPITDFPTAVKESSEGAKIVFYEEERAKSLRGVLAHMDLYNENGVALLIGPEGGFSDYEIIDAKKHGFISAGLGLRTLRSETAALSAITIVQYEYGYMGG